MILKKIVRLIGLSSLLVGLISSAVYASEEAQTGGYTIEGVPSNNQLDPDVGYFYLHEEVGEEDSVKVKLINSSSEEKTLNVKVTNANTNVNGIIDYTGRLEDHSSLQKPLTSIASVTEEEVKVPGDSSVETEISIKMPEQQLTGVIVGGIVVSEKQEESDTGEKLALSNTYSYTLGLVLTNEDKVELSKNISVELENVEATLFDGKKVVQANILNPNPYIFSSATVKGEILKKGSSTTVKKVEKENVNFAPYSVYPFQLDWEKENLKSGQYIFRGSVEADGETWEFEKEFVITSGEAKKINDESVYKVYIPTWVTISIYGLLIISIAGTIYLFLRRKKRKVA